MAASTSPATSSPIPSKSISLDSEWKTALETLEQQGRSITDCHLFLILGIERNSIVSLMASADLTVDQPVAENPATRFTIATGHRKSANHAHYLFWHGNSEASAEDATADLRQLGKLLRRSRGKLPAASGVAVWIAGESLWSNAGAEPSTDRRRLKNDFRLELIALRETLQVNCWLAIVLYGLESYRGGPVLAKRSTSELRANCLGYEWVIPRLSSTKQAIEFLSESLENLFCVELPNQIHQSLIGPEEAITGEAIDVRNRALIALSIKIRGIAEKRSLLAKTGLAFHAISEELGDTSLGCFVAMIGETSERQAFVPGVFRLLRSHAPQAKSLAPSIATSQPPAPPAGRRWWLYVVAAIALMLLLGIGGCLLFSDGTEPVVPPHPYAGEWRNLNIQPGSIQRLSIEEENGVFAVSIWEEMSTGAVAGEIATNVRWEESSLKFSSNKRSPSGAVRREFVCTLDNRRMNCLVSAEGETRSLERLNEDGTVSRVLIGGGVMQFRLELERQP
ncbi:hypothetical protein Psta_1942 [Pirellula staleyi DSM 6068]|uniref:Type VI secretion system component TssM1 N-terminal domain-containing protein n=1 Tax=Pirellula staleyi (strain ATCC 27377 / DSM 6068 / ICPB 4128) TaxID=530564 RepID=D2R0L8_PIRSD|nr:type VI secretion system protein [Pirellula staleyi]ADB16616.1 hypothetical protein Psta_1942 [Pirellula staleyi DSM 6068]